MSCPPLAPVQPVRADMHHLGEAKAAKRCIVSLCQLWMLHYYDRIDISSEASLTSLTSHLSTHQPECPGTREL